MSVSGDPAPDRDRDPDDGRLWDDPDPAPDPTPGPDPPVSFVVAGALCVLVTLYLVVRGQTWPAITSLGISVAFLFAVGRTALPTGGDAR